MKEKYFCHKFDVAVRSLAFLYKETKKQYHNFNLNEIDVIHKRSVDIHKIIMHKNAIVISDIANR